MLAQKNIPSLPSLGCWLAVQAYHPGETPALTCFLCLPFGTCLMSHVELKIAARLLDVVVGPRQSSAK